MRFAICNELFGDWPLEKGFDFAAEAGYAGVELAPFTLADYVTDLDAAARGEIRQKAERAGLEVVGLHWLLAKTEGFYLTSPDETIRAKTADYLNELARCCADVGGQILVLGSPQQRDLLPGVDRAAAMDYAAWALERVVPVLEQTGVVLAVEPLAPGDTTFLQSADDAVELIERIGSPQVRLHLDVKAMSGENAPPAEIIRKNAQLLAHFHANDANLQGPGFGEVDFMPIFEAFGEIDYRGWVSVEVFDYSPGVDRLARESLKYMEDCLKNLA